MGLNSNMTDYYGETNIVIKMWLYINIFSVLAVALILVVLIVMTIFWKYNEY